MFWESPWPGIALSGVLSVVFLVLWNSTQKKWFMYFSYACIAVAPLFVWLDSIRVTEREVIEHNVTKMAKHFHDREIDQLVAFVSPQHQKLSTIIRTAANLVNVQGDIRLTDMQVDLLAENSIAKIDFRANADLAVKGYGEIGRRPTRWLLTWRKEADEWKLVEIERKNPLTGEPMRVMDAD